MEYNRRKTLLLGGTTDEKLLHCGIQRKKTLAMWDTTEKNSGRCGIQPNNRRKPSPLYPTTEENLFHCIPQRRKTFSVVAHNAGNAFVLYHTTAKNLKLGNYALRNFSAKLFVSMNQDHRSQAEIQVLVVLSLN
jgi:hypothetical protein